MSNLSWLYPIALLLANLSLLLPDAHPLRIVGALLLIGLLPGLGWTDLLIAEGQAKGPAVSAPLARLTLATGLSYILTMLAGLLLHYLPGPVTNWQLLLCLDGIAFLGYTLSGYAKIRFLQARLPQSNQNLREKIEPQKIYTCPTAGAGQNLRALTSEVFKIFPLLLILLISLLLRGVNLGYSEFQGDESLAMISAAESLEGHEDALFLRAKGPGEVLLPMALWRLTGTTNESIARLPFALAGLGAVVTLYLLGRELKNERLGWLAAGFFALNGFAVAFSRIVQYQILVLWFSSLAFWLAWHWRRSGQWRWVVTAGLCLGAGLLAHYDAVLVVPAIGWLLLTANRRQPAAESDNGRWPAVGGRLAAAGFFVATLLFVALPFYLPYSLDPRANRTGEYVSDRIGSELRNNLPDFFHFNTFYSSSYYLILTGLLVFGLLAWFVAQKNKNKVGLKPTFIINGWRWGLAAVLVASIIGIIVKPDLLAWDIRLDLLDWHKLNLSALPFGLLLLVAFVVTPMDDPEQALIAWLAVPFLGYNFVVALGLTHIYTTVPAWSLLAALAWDSFWTRMNTDRHGFLLKFSNTLLMALLLTATVFLWNAFVRHDVEYWQDYPAGNLAFYWNPYPDLPRAGFFGFAHRAGWKTVGQKIAAGELSGDFGSNEEPDVTAWYTRGAPRACPCVRRTEAGGQPRESLVFHHQQQMVLLVGSEIETASERICHDWRNSCVGGNHDITGGGQIHHKSRQIAVIIENRIHR